MPNFIKRFLDWLSHLVQLRDVGHFLAAFLGAVAASVIASGGQFPSNRAGLIALGAGAFAVAFRKAFPSANISSTELTKYVGRLEALTEKLRKNPVVVRVPAAAPVLAAVPTAEEIANAVVQKLNPPPASDAPPADTAPLSPPAPPVDPAAALPTALVQPPLT